MVRGWSEKEAADFLGTHLKGDALLFYEQLSRDVRKSFRRACRALEKRFGPSLTPEAQRSRSANLHLEEKGALRQFADRVQGLAIEAYPDLPSTFIESEIINNF